MNIIFYSAIFLWIVLIVLFYKIYDKEYKISYKEKYNKFAPKNYTPLVASYILHFGNISYNEIITSFMFLAHKGIINIDKEKISLSKISLSNEENEETDYEIIPSERFLLKWFIDDIGNGEYVMLKSLKHSLRTKKRKAMFYNEFLKWKEITLSECSQFDFIKSKDDINIIGGFISSTYLLVGCILAIQSLRIRFVIFVILGIFMNIYVKGIRKRSRNGQVEYEQLMAYKRYLKNIPKDNEIDCIYSYVFDIDCGESSYSHFAESIKPILKNATFP